MCRLSDLLQLSHSRSYPYVSSYDVCGRVGRLLCATVCKLRGWGGYCLIQPVNVLYVWLLKYAETWVFCKKSCCSLFLCLSRAWVGELLCVLSCVEWKRIFFFPRCEWSVEEGLLFLPARECCKGGRGILCFNVRVFHWFGHCCVFGRVSDAWRELIGGVLFIPECGCSVDETDVFMSLLVRSALVWWQVFFFFLVGEY